MVRVRTKIYIFFWMYPPPSLDEEEAEDTAGGIPDDTGRVSPHCESPVGAHGVSQNHREQALVLP